MEIRLVEYRNKKGESLYGIQRRIGYLFGLIKGSWIMDIELQFRHGYVDLGDDNKISRECLTDDIEWAHRAFDMVCKHYSRAIEKSCETTEYKRFSYKNWNVVVFQEERSIFEYFVPTWRDRFIYWLLNTNYKPNCKLHVDAQPDYKNSVFSLYASRDGEPNHSNPDNLQIQRIVNWQNRTQAYLSYEKLEANIKQKIDELIEYELDVFKNTSIHAQRRT